MVGIEIAMSELDSNTDNWVETSEGYYHIGIVRDPVEVKYYINGILEYMCDAQSEWDK
jgi:hypothetical protein